MQNLRIIFLFLLSTINVSMSMDHQSYSINDLPTATKSRIIALIFCMNRLTNHELPTLCIQEIVDQIDNLFEPISLEDQDMLLNMDDATNILTHDNTTEETRREEHIQNWKHNKKNNPDIYQLNKKHGMTYQLNNVLRICHYITFDLRSDSYIFKKNNGVVTLLKDEISTRFITAQKIINNQHFIGKTQQSPLLTLYYLGPNSRKAKPIKTIKSCLYATKHLIENGIFSYINNENHVIMHIIDLKKYLHNTPIVELQELKQQINTYIAVNNPQY